MTSTTAPAPIEDCGTVTDLDSVRFTVQHDHGGIKLNYAGSGKNIAYFDRATLRVLIINMLVADSLAEAFEAHEQAAESAGD